MQYFKNFIEGIKELWNKKIILEIHAANHCNLNCIHCSHFSPVASPGFCNLEILERSLQKIKKVSDCFETIHILGGDPLLFPDLAKMLAITRRCLPNNTIKVFTNGILLSNEEKIPHGFWEACRENDIIIRLTPYPISIDYLGLKRKCETNGVRCEFVEHHGELNIEWHKQLFDINGSDCPEFKYRLFKSVKCKKRCFQLVEDKIYSCNATAYIKYLNKKFNTNFPITAKDYIKVDSLRNRNQLRRRLLFGTPFCSYCCVPVKSKWGISKKEASEWIKE